MIRKKHSWSLCLVANEGLDYLEPFAPDQNSDPLFELPSLQSAAPNLVFRCPVQDTFSPVQEPFMNVQERSGYFEAPLPRFLFGLRVPCSPPFQSFHLLSSDFTQKRPQFRISREFHQKNYFPALRRPDQSCLPIPPRFRPGNPDDASAP